MIKCPRDVKVTPTIEEEEEEEVDEDEEEAEEAEDEDGEEREDGEEAEEAEEDEQEKRRRARIVNPPTTQSPIPNPSDNSEECLVTASSLIAHYRLTSRPLQTAVKQRSIHPDASCFTYPPLPPPPTSTPSYISVSSSPSSSTV